jgi:hypothetical protein
MLLSLLWEYWWVIFLLNGFLGIYVFEKCYSHMDACKAMVEERDAMFPAMRRRDVKLWARWKYYPGAFLWLIPKMIICFPGFMLLVAW